MKTTTSLPALLGAVTVLCVLGASPTASAKKIVCWKNNEGVRECGNAVPPEYAQQSVERKSTMGITVEKTARAKTPEELEKERAEAERMRQEEAERKRLAAEKARHDRVLLQTFTTEEDLKLTRDGKVAAIDSRIKHIQQLVEKQEETRATMEAEAAGLERSGKKVPDDLRKRITDVQTQIDQANSRIQQREAEREQVQAQFEVDLARYRELKGG